ncbi:hypothetical protein MTO96_042038 [Rhipicephalus appendiculatus]
MTASIGFLLDGSSMASHQALVRKAAGVRAHDWKYSSRPTLKDTESVKAEPMARNLVSRTCAASGASLTVMRRNPNVLGDSGCAARTSGTGNRDIRA